jgi:hypothetical protein
MADKGTEQFFGAFLNDFEKARLSAGQTCSYFFSVGNFSIRLLFAGPALLEALTPALGHLSIEPVSEPDLTICCWDTETTGIPLSARPWKNMFPAGSMDIPYFQGGGFQAILNRGSGVFCALDPGSKTALYWHGNAALLPAHEKAAPFRALLQWALGTRGRSCIHSAAVSSGGDGILLAGRGKSGKSTTSLLCLLQGMDYAGDDYVVVGEKEKYHVYSLYNSVKIDLHSPLRIPGLEKLIGDPRQREEKKAVINLNLHYPERISRGFPLRAIFLPAVKGNGRTVITRVSAGQGILAIAPSTLTIQAGGKKETFDFLARMVHRVPCYRLELGRDPGDIPKRICDFISGKGWNEDERRLSERHHTCP